MKNKAKYAKATLTRENLAHTVKGNVLKDKLVSSGAIDLRNNHIVKDLHNGYDEIFPINPKKKFK